MAAFLFCLIAALPALAATDVTFSWQANPPEDAIVGYRLYYGPSSRLTGGSYQYYIDFTDWQRCPVAGDEADCQPLEDAATCEGLSQEYPVCTIHDLAGKLYFAMTAYNNSAESGYTGELLVDLGPTPGQLATLQQVYTLLLTGKK
jgi:hypothetical protein